MVQAREVCGGGVYDDIQCQRLQADLLASEGAIELAEGRLALAEKALQESLRLGREMRGDMDSWAARLHIMLGEVKQRQRRFDEAVDHYSAAWEVHEFRDGADGISTLRARLKVAEAEHLSGREDSAIESQKAVVDALRRLKTLPDVLVDAAATLARWLEGLGRDKEALEALLVSEQLVAENLGVEDPRAVDVKRDAALLYLKLGDHDAALQYLNDAWVPVDQRCKNAQSAGYCAPGPAQPRGG